MYTHTQSSHHFSLKIAWLCITLSPLPIRASTTHLERLTYEIGDSVYINPKVGKDPKLIHPFTHTKITLNVQGKGFNNAVSARFAPQRNGIFVAWQDVLAHFSTYQPKGSKTFHILDEKPKILIKNKAGIVSMPIFSANSQHAVIYHHFRTPHDEIHANYLHLTLDNQAETPLYRPSTQVSYDNDFDALLLGKITKDAQPLTYAALSNQGQLVTLTGYQTSDQSRQLACGLWEQGKQVMDNGQHYIEANTTPWLHDVVHIQCIEQEDNPTFHFWVLPSAHRGSHTPFSSLKVYATSWEKLIEGMLPDTSQAPEATLPLDFNKVQDAAKIVRVTPLESTQTKDTYAVTYLTQKDTIQATTLVHRKKVYHPEKSSTASLYIIAICSATAVVWIPYHLRSKSSTKRTSNAAAPRSRPKRMPKKPAQARH